MQSLTISLLGLKNFFLTESEQVAANQRGENHSTEFRRVSFIPSANDFKTCKNVAGKVAESFGGRTPPLKSRCLFCGLFGIRNYDGLKECSAINAQHLRHNVTQALLESRWQKKLVSLRSCCED